MIRFPRNLFPLCAASSLALAFAISLTTPTDSLEVRRLIMATPPVAQVVQENDAQETSVVQENDAQENDAQENDAQAMSGVAADTGKDQEGSADSGEDCGGKGKEG